MRLTRKHKEAMRTVVLGADIYDRSIAQLLREVELEDRSLIDIGKPRMYTGDGTDRVPYFGAILTKQGIRALTVTGATRPAGGTP